MFANYDQQQNQQPGLFQHLQNVIMSPMFMGGAAMAAGGGVPGMFQGLQAGMGMQKAQRDQRKEQQREQGYSALMNGDQAWAKDVNPGFLQLARMAGPEAGMPMLQQHFLKHPEMELERQRTAAQIEASKASAAASRANSGLTAVQIEQLKSTLDPTSDIKRREAQANHWKLEGPQREWFVRTGEVKPPEAKVNIIPDGGSIAVTDPRTAQTTITHGGTPKMSSDVQKAILENDDLIRAGTDGLSALAQAKKLNETAFDGALAGARGVVTSQFGPGGGQDTTVLSNLVTGQALQQLKATFGAAPTEGERKILLDIQGSVNQPKDVRARIWAEAEQLAMQRLAMHKQRGDEMRGGTFFKPGGGSAASVPKASAAPTAPPPPSPGTILNGFRFKGGNPADQSSWEKVR